MVPSGECLRGYKPGAAHCSRLVPSCGSFLSVLPCCCYTWPACWYLCCPAWQLVDCVCVSMCICHLSNKKLLHFFISIIIYSLVHLHLVSSLISLTPNTPLLSTHTHAVGCHAELTSALTAATILADAAVTPPSPK